MDAEASHTMTPPYRRIIRFVRLLAVGLAGAACMLVAAYQALIIHMMTQPVPSDLCCSTPADWGFPYKNVAFTSSDGVELSGWHIPTRNGATIIVLHGYNGNRTGMAWHAQVLAQHGYGVLLYDLRGHGQSSQEIRAYGWTDVEDVVAALDYLDEQSENLPRPTGILGFSMGGQIALRAAASTDRIHAVIADDPSFTAIGDSGSPRSALDTLAYLNRWLMFQGIALRNRMAPPPPLIDDIADIAPRPLLLISSEQGQANSHFRRYYEHAAEPKTLWEIPASSHGGNWIVAQDDYADKIVRFFDETLLSPQSR